uniref:60S ribosomal protein L23a n=1 Tax=Ascaris lumbricoides TaxID=6252 RepID=A0A0M3HGB0_ASCLU
MVFRKYRPNKQWGKMDTRIFKAILEARNKRKMPSFQVPDAVKVCSFLCVMKSFALLVLVYLFPSSVGYS